MMTCIRLSILALLVISYNIGSVSGYSRLSPRSYPSHGSIKNIGRQAIAKHVQKPLTSPWNQNTMHSLTAKSSDEVSSQVSTESEKNPLKIAFAAVWISLVVYVFGNIAPPDVSPTFTSEMIQKILTSPYDGTVNPIFVAIFNLLGVYPALFASFLLPGAKKQPVPAWPFVYGSFALGFFAAGPYLALRDIKTSGK